MAQGRGRSVRLRRLAGFLWLTVWTAVLYAVAAPWRDLGGLVDERLRWLEWFVLPTGLSLGFTLGRFGRDAAYPGSGRTHARLLRFLLYPPMLLTAISLVALTLFGQREGSNVVLTAFLAYWAGLDIAYGAVPLMEGKCYRFNQSLDPEPDRSPDPPGTTWVPPWERF